MKEDQMLLFCIIMSISFVLFAIVWFDFFNISTWIMRKLSFKFKLNIAAAIEEDFETIFDRRIVRETGQKQKIIKTKFKRCIEI